PALEKFYFDRSGSKRLMKEINERAQQGIDPFATETIERLVRYFGRALSVVTNILDPDAIVIGGGLGNMEILYERGRVAVQDYIFNDKVFETPMLRPKLGDSAGVFGAAFLNVD